jgi:hypothetical protein
MSIGQIDKEGKSETGKLRRVIPFPGAEACSIVKNINSILNHDMADL